MKMLEMELACELNDEELQSRGRMLSETIWHIDETEEARTNAMKEFKETLVGLHETQRKLAKVIVNRVEMRMVRVQECFHSPREGIKQLVRMDTGEVVRELEMTVAEKQLILWPS